MNIYVPERTDFKELEEIYKAKETITSYKRDKLAYVLHLFYEIPMYNKRFHDEDGFIPISSAILEDRLGAHYKLYLDFLIKAGVIEKRQEFIIGKRSNTFRLATEY